MKKIKLNLAIFYLLISTALFCQKEAFNWYFGNNCALSFSTNPPTIVSGSAMNPGSGCGASVSDKNGNLLFYSNGMTVWNGQNNIMANGSGLAGAIPVEQVALAVKQPGNNSIYYVFTNYQAGALGGGFRYSVVDMSLAAGLGSVTSMNNPILTPGSEKVCATRHCNGTDIWIVTHAPGTNNFLAYLLTGAGLNIAPVVSAVGPTYCNQIGCGGGQLKFNAFGSKLADAENGLSNASLSVYDFDKSSGIVNNSISLNNVTNVLANEFSSDGSKFYATENSNTNYILQWDLCAGSVGAINASMDTIGVSSSSNVAFLFMQLALDGKIYVSRSITSTLSVINAPNQSGAACNFVEFGQIVGTSLAKGLPGFMSNLLSPVFTQTSVANCSKASFSSPVLSCIQSSAVTGYFWNFGDTGSGLTNTTTIVNPSHNFSAGGIYTVTSVISYSTCIADTFKVEVYVPSTPQLSLSGKQSICKNETTTLSVLNTASSYTWSNGSNTQSVSLTPSITGVYSVSVNLTSSCVASKIVTVTVKPCTGISEFLDSGNQIHIYPNPHQNELTVDVKVEYQAVLIDYLGRVVKEQILFIGSNTLSVQENLKGIYFLRLVNATNMKTFKLVKE